MAGATPATTFDCQSCGACCAVSAKWPRFSTESETDLQFIPSALVSPDLSGMLCHGDRCAALFGVIGEAAGCSIYPARPDVCRACQPGDPECLMARRHHGLN